MKSTMAELLSLANVIETLLHITDEKGEKVNRKMPFKVKSRLVKAAGKMKNELNLYEQERSSLVTEFGEEDPDVKGSIKVKDENMEAFYAKLSEVLKTEIQMNLDYCKLTEDDIDNIEGGDIELLDEEVLIFNTYMLLDGEDEQDS